MSQGIVTYDAGGKNMGLEALADPARAWSVMEDFNGALFFNKNDGGSTDTAILGYPGVLCSTDGTAANQTALAAGAEAGGTVTFTPGDGATEGITIPTALIVPNNGKRWFMEVRLKINVIASGLKIGLSESVSPTAVLSGAGASVDGGAGVDQIMVGFDTTTTTDGNLEYYMSRNGTTGVHSGVGGMHADAQMAVDTYHRIGIEGDGVSAARFYFDGNLMRATGADANGFVDAGAYVPNVACAPMIAADDDESTVEVDYIYVACER